MPKLTLNYYRQNDVVSVARDLLGKILFTNINGTLCAGRITETEAYRAKDDKACHAYGNKRTKRTEIMFQSGGVAYVYLCYGIHHLFNIITNEEEHAEGILIRAIEPLEGVETMLKRKGMNKLAPRLSSGPGCMSKAMGITQSLNGVSLLDSQVWLEDSRSTEQQFITQTTRIGVDYAGEDALLPWRFYINDSLFVSKR